MFDGLANTVLAIILLTIFKVAASSRKDEYTNTRDVDSVVNGRKPRISLLV